MNDKGEIGGRHVFAIFMTSKSKLYALYKNAISSKARIGQENSCAMLTVDKCNTTQPVKT